MPLLKRSTREEMQLLRLLEDEDRERCVRSLSYMLRASFPVLEPGRPYAHGWHIDLMSEYLMAVTSGQIRSLIFNVPYRTTKSLLVSVVWPIWCWLQERTGITSGPETRFLTLSHGSDMSTNNSLRSRVLLESAWFIGRFGDRIQLRSDQNAKNYYVNKSGGYRLALGFDSAVTGRDGDVQVVDDPHDAERAMYSDADRQTDIRTWDQKLANRLTNLEKGARVLVMQRLHPNDLSQRWIETMNEVVHVMLPMRYEPERAFFGPLGSDPRTESGELLCVERFSEPTVKAEEVRLGTSGALAQLQQRPVPIGGTIIQLDWFKRYAEPPAKFAMIAVFWDTAQKDKELNDPWAGGVWGETENGQLYLLEVTQSRMTYPTGKRAVKSLWLKWKSKGATAVVIEDKNTGSSLIQELPGEGVPCLAFMPEGDKVSRMAIESPVVEAGMVWLPSDAPWLFDYEAEIGTFPASPTKDQVDMTSMALRWFRERREADFSSVSFSSLSMTSRWEGTRASA